MRFNQVTRFSQTATMSGLIKSGVVGIQEMVDAHVRLVQPEQGNAKQVFNVNQANPVTVGFAHGLLLLGGDVLRDRCPMESAAESSRPAFLFETWSAGGVK